MENQMFKFDIFAGVEFQVEDEDNLTEDVVEEDWFLDWLFSQADTFEPSLRFGALDDDCEPVDPEIPFFNGHKDYEQMVVDDEALSSSSSVSFNSFIERGGKQYVSFTYSEELRIGISAATLEDAKQLAEKHVKNSFYMRKFEDNDVIEELSISPVRE